MIGLTSTISLAMGSAWASGINLYATILVLGLLSRTGNIALPENLTILSNQLVILAAAVMYTIEFFADKIPGIDNSWDALHTFIRIPAGAVLAAGAIGEVSFPIVILAGIFGGGIAASTHFSKAATRVAINSSPEPVSNWTSSVAEDGLVLAGLWSALNHPWLFLTILLATILFAAWILPKASKKIARIINKLSPIFHGDRDKS